MFNEALAFNGDLSNWNVSNVTSMRRMFQGAESFNAEISSWDVSSVKDMSGMFFGASSFNQRPEQLGCVQHNQYAWYVYYCFSSFNGNISNWDVIFSSCTDMSSMFFRTAFDRDLSNWNVSPGY
ncbi:MAG: BspA family leucine-rich repeat surface protein [Balneolaceae bacterium]|nr:BspA family leucine-rich repeat surface protein [Balneolaceae bacterium]